MSKNNETIRPCAVSFPPSLRLRVQIERESRARPVPQWLLEIPRLVIIILRQPTSRSPSGLRALIHTPDTLTYLQ
jgi:hypothetical protein